MPHATIATSPPSRNVCALPISNGVWSVVMTADSARAKRRYAGPQRSATASVAFFVCAESHGTITIIFGITRMIAMSSIAWCVAPSGPTETPACAPAIFTLVSLSAIVVRTCSHDASGIEHRVAGDERNLAGRRHARPPSRRASARRRRSRCSGRGTAFLKPSMRVDSERSAQIAMTFGSRRPASIKPSPKPLRVGICLIASGFV